MADLFEGSGGLIIPISTTFDTDIHSGIISERSLLGQFIGRHFTEVRHLDKEIEDELCGREYEVLPEANRRAKLNRYSVGTTVRSSKDGRNFYLLATSHMNGNGNASADFGMITDSLAALWQYLPDQGDLEKDLRIPVLGSGFSRIQKPREELIRGIIDSFIAACHSQKICDTLTICISPSDFYRLSIGLTDLENYLDVRCRYAKVSVREERSVGMPTR